MEKLFRLTVISLSLIAFLIASLTIGLIGGRVRSWILNGYCAEPVYTEKVVIDKIEILEDGQIQIRMATKVFKDGVEVAKTYWRTVLAPDQDLSKIVIAPNITKEDADKVKAVANVVWTDTVKKAYLEAKKNNEIIK